MIHDYTVWLAIAACALVTYAIRAGGLLMAQRMPETGPLNRAMQALPGCILISLVAPGIFSEGPWGAAAAGLTALVAYFGKNVFLAMLAGMAVMICVRQFGL